MFYSQPGSLVACSAVCLFDVEWSPAEIETVTVIIQFVLSYTKGNLGRRMVTTTDNEMAKKNVCSRTASKPRSLMTL